GCATGRIADLQCRGPRAASVCGASVEYVPPIGIVASACLHVPDAHVAAAGGCKPRPRCVLARDRKRSAGAPRSTGVRGACDVDALWAAGYTWPLIGEHEVSRRIGDDRRLPDVEVGVRGGGDAGLNPGQLRD